MPNTEPDRHRQFSNSTKEDMKEDLGFCQKFQEEVPLEKGCPHPRDYCPHRTACFLYLIWKEKRKGRHEDPLD